MHDRAVVVDPDVVTVADVLVEVVFLACLDVLPVDGYEVVAVFTALLMPETDGVTDLVDRPSGVAARGERDVLLPDALHPHGRRATIAGAEVHEIGVAGGVSWRPLDESYDRVGFPVCDRIGDSLLGGQCRVDVIGNHAVRPAELAPGKDDRLFDVCPPHYRVTLFDLFDAAEVDVALEDRTAADDRVLDGSRPEGQARDEGRPDLFRSEQLGIVLGLGALTC